MKLLMCLTVALTVVCITTSKVTQVQIDTTNVKETIPERFLSVTIDSALVHTNWSALALRYGYEDSNISLAGSA